MKEEIKMVTPDLNVDRERDWGYIIPEHVIDREKAIINKYHDDNKFDNKIRYHEALGKQVGKVKDICSEVEIKFIQQDSIKDRLEAMSMRSLVDLIKVEGLHIYSSIIDETEYLFLDINIDGDLLNSVSQNKGEAESYCKSLMQEIKDKHFEMKPSLFLLSFLINKGED